MSNEQLNSFIAEVAQGAVNASNSKFSFDSVTKELTELFTTDKIDAHEARWFKSAFKYYKQICTENSLMDGESTMQDMDVNGCLEHFIGRRILVARMSKLEDVNGLSRLSWIAEIDDSPSFNTAVYNHSNETLRLLIAFFMENAEIKMDDRTYELQYREWLGASTWTPFEL